MIGVIDKTRRLEDSFEQKHFASYVFTGSMVVCVKKGILTMYKYCNDGQLDICLFLMTISIRSHVMQYTGNTNQKCKT